MTGMKGIPLKHISLKYMVVYRVTIGAYEQTQ